MTKNVTHARMVANTRCAEKDRCGCEAIWPSIIDRGRAGDLAFQYDSPCRIIQRQGWINTKVWAWPSPSPDRAITFEGLQVRVDGSIVGCTRTASSASADGAFNRKKMKSHETFTKRYAGAAGACAQPVAGAPHKAEHKG